MSYHEHTDKRFARQLRAGAPEAFAALMDFNAKALEGENSAIPRKYVELIAMGIALTTQCAYCIEIHAAAARDEGVTQQELAETVMIASSLRAGGSFAHGFMAMKFFEQAEANATQA